MSAFSRIPAVPGRRFVVAAAAVAAMGSPVVDANAADAERDPYRELVVTTCHIQKFCTVSFSRVPRNTRREISQVNCEVATSQEVSLLTQSNLNIQNPKGVTTFHMSVPIQQLFNNEKLFSVHMNTTLLTLGRETISIGFAGEASNWALQCTLAGETVAVN
jgi:hypothetical protein